MFIDIWHVENKSSTSLILLPLGGNVFRVVQAGEYKAFLENPRYTLLHKKYENILIQLQDQLTWKKAKITDFLLKTENEDYYGLRIANAIDPVSIRQLESKGNKIWEYGGHVFVSGALKAALIKIDSADFEFSLGFSDFGG